MNNNKHTEAVTWMGEFLKTVKCRDSDLQPLHLVLQDGWKEPDPTEEETLFDILKRKKREWWYGHHFQLGMWIRNMLRSNGFGEKELEVENLDDYYIDIVKDAVA